MRTPYEIKIGDKTLTEIIELHRKLIDGESGGSRANLYGANLSGAESIIASGPIGSRGDFIFGIRHEKVIMIKTGCFWGTLTEFKNAVKKTNNDNEYAQAYAAAIVFIRKYFAVKP